MEAQSSAKNTYTGKYKCPLCIFAYIANLNDVYLSIILMSGSKSS